MDETAEEDYYLSDERYADPNFRLLPEERYQQIIREREQLESELYDGSALNSDLYDAWKGDQDMRDLTTFAKSDREEQPPPVDDLAAYKEAYIRAHSRLKKTEKLLDLRSREGCETEDRLRRDRALLRQQLAVQATRQPPTPAAVREQVDRRAVSREQRRQRRSEEQQEAKLSTSSGTNTPTVSSRPKLTHNDATGRRASVARAMDAALLENSAPNIQYIRPLPDLTQSKYVLTSLSSQAIKAWRKELNTLRQIEGGVIFRMGYQISEDVLGTLLGYLHGRASDFDPESIFSVLCSKVRSVEDMKELHHSEINPVLYLYDSPTSRNNYAQKLRSSVAWKAHKPTGPDRDLPSQVHSAFIISLSNFLNDVELSVHSFNDYGGHIHCPEVSVSAYPEGLLHILKSIVSTGDSTVAKELFADMLTRVEPELTRKWKLAESSYDKDLSVTEFKEEMMRLAHFAQALLIKADSVLSILSGKSASAKQTINVISSQALVDPKVLADEIDDLGSQSISAVGFTPRGVLKRAPSSTSSHVSFPSKGSRTAASRPVYDKPQASSDRASFQTQSSNARAPSTYVKKTKGACYRQFRLQDCSLPIDPVTGFCAKGSHMQVDLEAMWEVRYRELLNSPFASDSVKSLAPSSRLPSVKTIRFGDFEPVPEDDIDEEVDEDNAIEEELSGDRDGQFTDHLAREDFSVVFDNAAETWARRILSLETSGKTHVPLMSVDGAVTVVDGKQLSIGKVLMDTQCLPHSVMPFHLFEQLGDDFLSDYEAKISSATLADFSTTVKVEGFLNLRLVLSHLGKEYSAGVRFALIHMPNGSTLLGLHDCLLKFYPLFKALLDETLGVLGGSAPVPNLVAALRPGEKPPPDSLDMNTTDATSEFIGPWTKPLDPVAPEEVDTPMPSSFSGPLQYLSKPWDEVHAEFLASFDEHVSPEMRAEVPEILDLLRSEESLNVFLPKQWTGLRKFPPLELEFLDSMPTVIRAQARHINPRLMEAAEEEFKRLRRYFYEPSTSLVVSPLVIAPKATKPFIRFCADLREVNKHVKIPQRPIPHVQYALEKAAKFSVFGDLDATNSFHQIILGPKTSELLSVKTPWGIFKPRFLPEGVGPASGVLQEYVAKIFEEFEEWTIVIFDNFLVLAYDYRDLFAKIQLVLGKANEHELVLKFAKSWIGFREVSFFGYQLSSGKYGMSEARKAQIQAMAFPTSRNGMQRFLGSGLFFKPFVPDYSNLAAPLNAMIHNDFNWDEKTWTRDYRADFEQYKIALQRSVEKYFPDYSADWTLRADASQVACGAVLLQKVRNPLDHTELVWQVISLASMKFTSTAQRWDIHKKECYALFYAFKSFGYYLVGKPVTLETDHANLLAMESSQAAIVIRWRVYMQNFIFVIKHIPGKENVTADYLSRMYDDLLPLASSTDQKVNAITECNLADSPIPSPGPPRNVAFPHPPEYYFSLVHGGRRGHWSARVCWNRLNAEFPGHRIPYAFLEDLVAKCPTCQKTRLGMTDRIVSLPRNLQVSHAHRRVGVDRLAVTPPDRDGYSNLICIVEIYTSFFQAYPAKEYTATSLATTLFQFYCSYGTFDEIISDPGSDLMSDAVKILHKWLGMQHVVSVVDRHESNGVERHNAECLRHLSALVHDERMKDRWSDPTIISLVNFAINDATSRETGVRPFDAKFGSFAGTYFRLPSSLPPQDKPARFLKLLNEDIQRVHEIVSSTKSRQVIKRLGNSTEATQNQYQQGDFILFLRYPVSSLRPEKLTARWAGPFKVVNQVHNDVHVHHCATGKDEVLHVDRCKIFHGTAQAAFDAAMRDQDQYQVVRILAWRGPVAKRKSLEFLVLFADGDAIWKRYSQDLYSTQAFSDFCMSKLILRELLLSPDQALAWKKQILQTPIDKLQVFSASGELQADYQPAKISFNTLVYVDLRSWSDESLKWYYNLKLPDPDLRTYVLEAIYGEFLDPRHLTVMVTCPVLDESWDADSYWVYAYGTQTKFNAEIMTLVNIDFLLRYPEILPFRRREKFLESYGQV